jgi:hypothetical protein
MFDWKYYINKYEDLRAAGITTAEQALTHWLQYGMNEGRKSNNILDSQIPYTFNWKYYIAKYEDLRVAGITTEEQALTHWLQYGMNEGRKCNVFIKYKISIILVLHNNKNWLNYIDIKFKKLEKKYNLDFEYFIYENNSNKEFKLSLKKFMNGKYGKLLSEDIDVVKYESIISKERGLHMNYIRNRNKLNHGELNSNFVLLLDADVYFNDNVIIKYINHLLININTTMITGYPLCRVGTFNKLKMYHYYDTLAFSTEKYNYLNNHNTCLLEKCKMCTSHRSIYNISIDNSDLIKDGDILKLKSVFGSFGMIPTHIYNKVDWNSNHGLVETDHYGFCQELKKFGDIVFDTNIKYIKHKDQMFCLNNKYVKQFDKLSQIPYYYNKVDNENIYYIE